MNPKIVFVLILTFTLGLKVNGQNHYFRHYSNTEGFPQAFVYDLEQDDQGYLWIGTPEGLYKFNGFEFQAFTVQDSLANDFVSRIYSDSKGRMWFGHQNGSISLLFNDVFTPFHQQSPASGMVTDLAEDPQGNIWFSTQNLGLGLIDEELRMKSVSFPVESESLSQIESLGDDLFLIGTQENLYITRYVREQSSMSITTKYVSFPSSKVVDIFPGDGGDFFIVSQEEGLYHLLPDSLSGSYILSEIDNNLDGAVDMLHGGLLDSNGRLWLNSMGNGLVQYRPDSRKQFVRSEKISTNNGLISNNIRSMYEDREGNIWLAAFGDGLLKYVNNQLQFYNFGLEDHVQDSYAITGDSDKLLVVSANHLVWVDPVADTILSSFSLPESAPDDKVITAYLADDGTLWLGYQQSGLYTLDMLNRQFKSIFISNDALTNSINHITGKGDDIWVSTKKGIFRINRESNSRKWFTTNDGLPHNNVRQLLIDARGRVLIATLCSEIYFINEYQEIEALVNGTLGPHTSVVSINEDKNGAIWAATQGNGLWKIGKDTSYYYTRISGLYSDFCYSLAITDQGNPVTTHKGGISQINLESRLIKTFGRLEGVSSSSDFYSNALFTDHLGNIWFGSSDGLVKYSSQIAKGGMMPPTIRIVDVKVDGQNVDLSRSPLVLKSGRHELSVEYIGLNFTNPEGVFYQTKLEGYNRDWSVPTFSRTITFDRLDHGDYSFLLRAYNENEISSELSPAFELRIKKPVFVSFWFYALITVLLGIAFYLILQFRERYHKMTRERLLRNLDDKSKEIIVKEEIIKERKKVEKVLIEAKAKAELSEKLKTSFLQNMSHEIRTPMNAIVGFSQLLKDDEIEESERNIYIDTVTDNATSLLHLIDDILDVSQLESHQLAVEKESCALHPLMMELQSIYEKKLVQDGKELIKLSVNSPPDRDINMMTDAARLKQVMMKLLDNAVKFTESGEICFGFALEEEQVLFFVEDTGIGLSADKKEVIFDLFRKIEEDKVKMNGGTGLGLTMARYLVSLMGGEIDVESHEGLGSKFFFELPYQMGPEITAQSNNDKKEIDFEAVFHGKRILVVEDTDSNFQLMNKVLSPCGALIERAVNGEKALKMIGNDEAFDMIIMDIKLPGMDGYEITRKIREKNIRIPIISHTAYALEGDREKSLEAGCTDYLSKPTERIQFLRTLANYL